MSLDVYLTTPDAVSATTTSHIFVREGGTTVELTREEWNARHPGREPVVVTQANDNGEVFTANITHNLNKMADAAGIYEALWRPEEIGVSNARELRPFLWDGLQRLKANPERYKAFNPPNGWGTYEALVSFVERYLEACTKHPNAEVSVWR